GLPLKGGSERAAGELWPIVQGGLVEKCREVVGELEVWPVDAEEYVANRDSLSEFVNDDNIRLRPVRGSVALPEVGIVETRLGVRVRAESLVQDASHPSTVLHSIYRLRQKRTASIPSFLSHNPPDNFNYVAMD